MSSEDSAKGNVLTPLKRLGIIDDNGKPTQLANDWRLDDKYKTSCEAMIASVYPQEFVDLFMDENFDRAAVNNWFMGHGVGSGAAGKMTALFVLLKSGEVKDQQSQKSSSPKKSASKPTIKSKTKAVEENTLNNRTAGQDKEPAAMVSENVDKRPNLHIDLQIHISPESTPEQIETIFASMAKHFYGADKV